MLRNAAHPQSRMNFSIKIPELKPMARRFIHSEAFMPDFLNPKIFHLLGIVLGHRPLLPRFLRFPLPRPLLQLVDHAEHLGHRHIPFARDGLVDVDILRQGARERDVLDLDDVVLLGDRLDPLGHFIVAFGDDDGSEHLEAIVFERDGDVGRVGDDHVGLGYFLHHASPCHFALQAADAAFDHGIAFRLLDLIAHLLFGQEEIVCKNLSSLLLEQY